MDNFPYIEIRLITNSVLESTAGHVLRWTGAPLHIAGHVGEMNHFTRNRGTAVTMMKKKILATGIAAGIAAFSAAAMADAVTDRQAAMKEAKQNFKPLVGMVKGKVPFDAATVKKNAMAIAAALEKAKKLFPEGSEKGEKDSRAKPEIWMMKDEFNAAFDKSIRLARAIEGAGDVNALKGAVMALGGDGCKACHKKFRLPKKK